MKDVNNDGNPDLIFSSGNGVNVLLGNGNGSFHNHPLFSAGTVEFMSAADFNKDGHVDLAVTDGFSSLSIMLGNGNGTFTVAGSNSLTGNANHAIAIGDYNRDGLLDVALPDGHIFLGNGDGTLRSSSAFPTLLNALVIGAADVNGDGITDLVTGYPGLQCGQTDFGTTGVSLGNGDSTFQPVVAFDFGGCGRPGNQISMAIEDLNNDGFADVVVLGNSDQLSALVNTGNGTFPAAELNMSGGSGSVAVDDFDHDGNADLVLADGTVYLGNGDGTLRFKANASLGGVALMTGDFNRDGIPDPATAVECAAPECSSGGALLIAQGNGDGTFQTPTSLPSGGFYAEFTIVADFTGDGSPDVALVNNCTDYACSSGGSVSVFINNGNGAFSLVNTIVSINGVPLSVVAGDFNNDGIADLAVVGRSSSQTGGVVNLLLGNGDGTFQPPQVLITPLFVGAWDAAVTGDFNNDGILDLALSEATCSDCVGRGQILYGHGDGTFVEGPEIGTEGGPSLSVVSADFYGAGTPIPVLANRCGDFLDCPLGSIMIPGTQNETKIMLSFLAVGDFNNDGKPDLAGSLQFDAGASVLLNIGATAAATTTTISPAAPQSYSVTQPATFTAEIHHTGPETLKGTVQFLDGGVLIGSGSVHSNGHASLTTTGLAVGSHFVVAYYRGDSSFASSNSLGTHVTIVTKATTATSLLSSINPSVSGKAVTFTATVSSSAGIPTGKVQFLNGPTVLATLTLTSGSARYTTAKLPPGANCITAVYEGDPKDSSSTSAPVNQFVLAATTTTLTSLPNPSAYGQTVIFTARVTSSSGTPLNGESVTFQQGVTVLGTGTLAGGTATFSTSTLGLGTKTIKAFYSGDATFANSTSAPVSQVIRKAATTTTLVSSFNPSNYGQSVTFTVDVRPQFGGTPTGSVTFRDGTTTLKTVPLSGGAALITTSKLAHGTHSITATFNGSADFFSSSVALAQMVN